MADRRDAPKPAEESPPTPPEGDAAYTEEEEAEVQKRLEDLGYVE
jgi:hypothetical protein